MKDYIKTLDEIKKMKIAGKLASDVLMMIKDHVRPGISTGELDRICHNYIVDIQKAIPAPLNYKGFPKSICTSINHQICHFREKNLVLFYFQNTFLFRYYLFLHE